MCIYHQKLIKEIDLENYMWFYVTEREINHFSMNKHKQEKKTTMRVFCNGTILRVINKS